MSDFIPLVFYLKNSKNIKEYKELYRKYPGIYFISITIFVLQADVENARLQKKTATPRTEIRVVGVHYRLRADRANGGKSVQGAVGAGAR